MSKDVSFDIRPWYSDLKSRGSSVIKFKNIYFRRDAYQNMGILLERKGGGGV